MTATLPKWLEFGPMQNIEKRLETRITFDTEVIIALNLEQSFLKNLIFFPLKTAIKKKLREAVSMLF